MSKISESKVLKGEHVVPLVLEGEMKMLLDFEEDAVFIGGTELRPAISDTFKVFEKRKGFSPDYDFEGVYRVTVEKIR